jgi:hypothetical protein
LGITKHLPEHGSQGRGNLHRACAASLIADCTHDFQRPGATRQPGDLATWFNVSWHYFSFVTMPGISVTWCDLATWFSLAVFQDAPQQSIKPLFAVIDKDCGTPKTSSTLRPDPLMSHQTLVLKHQIFCRLAVDGN